MIKILLTIWVAVALFMSFVFCAAARRFVSEDPPEKTAHREKKSSPDGEAGDTHSPASTFRRPNEFDQLRRITVSGGWGRQTEVVTLSGRKLDHNIS